MNNDGNNTECECVLNPKFDLMSIGFEPHTFTIQVFPLQNVSHSLISDAECFGPYVKNPLIFTCCVFFHIVSLCNL